MTPGKTKAVKHTALPSPDAEMLVMALAVHGKQDAPPGGEVVPAEQVGQDEAPLALEDVPAGQFVHVDDPGDVLYVP